MVQFASLVVHLITKVVLKYFMASGAQFAMTSGIWMMPQLCVDNSVTYEQFLLILDLSLAKELDQFGWTIYTALEQKQDLTSVPIMELEYITAYILRMLLLDAQVKIYVCIYSIENLNIIMCVHTYA